MSELDPSRKPIDYTKLVGNDFVPITATKAYEGAVHNIIHGYRNDLIKSDLSIPGVPHLIDTNPLRQTTADGKRVLVIKDTQLLWPPPTLD